MFERPTFLGTAEWRSVPWEKQSKNSLQSLLDILSLLPHLLLGSQKLATDISTTTEASRQFEVLFGLHKHLDDSLDRWLQDLKASRVGPLFWPKPAKVSSVARQFADQLEYANLADSQLFTLYWEAKLHCHEAVQRLFKSKHLPSSIGGMKEEKTCVLPLMECADRICQSTTYMQDQSFGILGMHLTIYPILAARRFYDEVGSQEKYAFCHALVENMVHRPFSIFSRY